MEHNIFNETMDETEYALLRVQNKLSEDMAHEFKRVTSFETQPYEKDGSFCCVSYCFLSPDHSRKCDMIYGSVAEGSEVVIHNGVIDDCRSCRVPIRSVMLSMLGLSVQAMEADDDTVSGHPLDHSIMD